MRKGQSRLWFDDHGFWAVLVEFQPSGWSRGNYLNVGLSWLFRADSGWAFHIGYREAAFAEARSAAQFGPAAAEAAEKAAALVRDYRKRFTTLDAMYAHYRDKEKRMTWDSYHAAVLAGLIGKAQSARAHFAEILAVSPATPWQAELQRECRGLQQLVASAASFRDGVRTMVSAARASRNMPTWPGATLFPP